MYVLDLMVEQIFISLFFFFCGVFLPFFGQHSAFMQTHLRYMHKDSKRRKKD